MITAQSTSTILNIKSYLSQHILASKKKHCQSTYDVGKKKKKQQYRKKLAIGRHPVMARHFVLSIKTRLDGPCWAGHRNFLQYIVVQLTRVYSAAAAYYITGPAKWRCDCVLLRFQLLSRRCRDSLCHSTHTIGPRGIPHNATSDPNFGPQGPSGTLISIDQVGFFKVNIIKFHKNRVIQQFVRF